MPGQAARARRPVTSRQRGRSVRRTRRVDRPSTRDTLGAHDERTKRVVGAGSSDPQRARLAAHVPTAASSPRPADPDRNAPVDAPASRAA